MRVAHINYIPTPMLGVNKKLGDQAYAAKQLGVNIDFIVLSTKKIYEDNNLRYIKIELSNFSILRKIKNLFFAYSIIDKYIDINSYDYIVVRYIVPDISSFGFIKKYGYKVITEHHTNELIELKLYKGLSNKIRYLMEKYFASAFLSKCKGIISVTNEIEKIELSRATVKNTIVISNGIATQEKKLTKFKVFDNKELVLIFVASYTAIWQGLYRVMEGLSLYKNHSIKITLLIVGEVSDSCQKKINEIIQKNNHIIIEQVGKLYGEELDECFRKSNIAISSLGLHEKNMNEACSLKTREYIARGIPFVYGYDDTDLTGKEPFALKVPANDEPLDIEEIIRFSQEVSEIKDISQTMRDFALKKLDWKIKIQQMYDFVESIDKNK